MLDGDSLQCGPMELGRVRLPAALARPQRGVPDPFHLHEHLPCGKQGRGSPLSRRCCGGPKQQSMFDQCKQPSIIMTHTPHQTVGKHVQRVPRRQIYDLPLCQELYAPTLGSPAHGQSKRGGHPPSYIDTVQSFPTYEKHHVSAQANETQFS